MLRFPNRPNDFDVYCKENLKVWAQHELVVPILSLHALIQLDFLLRFICIKIQGRLNAQKCSGILGSKELHQPFPNLVVKV